MSGGQLEVHGLVEDWSYVKSYLLDNTSNSERSNDDDEVDWSNTNWGWPNEDESILDQIGSKNVKSDKRQSLEGPSDLVSDKKETSIPATANVNLSWLDDSIIANSPAGDVLTIARGSKAIFFKSECNIDTNGMKFIKSFEGILSEEEGEIITSIVCIPLDSKKRTSPGAPDWTCIVVGFNRGYVRVYTETGSLLVSEQFHNERVQGFKVRSYVPSFVPLQHDQLEELIVLYRSVVVTMDGFGIFQTLRACRNHLARLKANATENPIEPPSLMYKKWGFESEQTVVDCEPIGLNTPSAFDHLFTASLLGGFNAKTKQNPPTSCVFASTGLKPFVAYHYAQENQAVPVLTEMAYAVASKVKSSILNAATGWLGFGGGSGTTTNKNLVKEAKSFEPPTPMLSRFGLPDARRHGKSITSSPSRNLSAVTDSFGRVILIDNVFGIAIRVWKGYRDAQCSWLQVDEELSSRAKVKDTRTRTALFLVIYAPRRGHLEVYAMQQGPKVATFNVNKPGRLLCTTFGMMGLNNAPVRGGNRPIVECLFVDCDGNLFTLNIPFHLGLCDKTSSKVKDIHLLKTLQKLLRDGHYTATTVLQIFTELRTQSMINQGFRILTQKCNKFDIFIEVLQTYSQKFCDGEDKDLTVVFGIIALLELYQSLLFSQSSPPAYSSHENTSADDKSLLLCLHANEKEMKIMQGMAEEEVQCKMKPKAVTFQSDLSDMSVNEFFGAFVIEFDYTKIKMSNTNISHLPILINFKSEGVDKLGELLLCGCLNGTADLDEWKQKLKNAGIDAYAILLLSFKYWCQNSLLSSSYIGLMEKLYYVVKKLCDLEGYGVVISEFNQVSKWWEEIRKEITRNSKIFPIYSFAIVCRAVAIDLQHQRETENLISTGDKLGRVFDVENTNKKEIEETAVAGPSSNSMEMDFENISLDLLKWNILLKQIEDLCLLSSILVQNPCLDKPQLPLLKTTSESLTVIKLLDKGKGCIAELVGRWLTTIGIEPNLITDSKEDEAKSASSDEKMTVTGNSSQSQPHLHEQETDIAVEALEANKSINYVLDLLRSLRENFSVSLSSSIILSNYCWEYCLEWKNETNNVEYLGAAVKCASAIPSHYIRQGMISMMWNIFLCKKFSTVTAISKTAREKLADKLSGFSSQKKQQKFLAHIVQFLDLFLETNIVCEGKSLPRNSTLKNHWSSDVNSNASLTDLALVQPLPNFEMILLHYQLALCAQFFYTFRLKGTMKPTNLFDTKSRNLFFQNMHNLAPFSNVEVDLSLKTLREEFLCVVVTSAIRAIPEEPNPLGPNSSKKSIDFQPIIPSEEGVKESEEWVNKCLEMGRIWGLELDGLRISYAFELYQSGLDYLGLEAIGAVDGRDVLGARLLLVAGMRVSYIINVKRENVMEIVSSISTNLSKWLDSLDYSNLGSLRFSKESIGELTQQVLQLIPPSSYDYKLAEELLLSSKYL